MTRIIQIIFFLLLFTIPLHLTEGNKSDIYKAYVTGNMQLWKNIIDRMNAEQPSLPEAIAELLNYQYGYLGWCVGNKKNEEAKKYLDLAEKNLEILNNQNYSSLVNSYKAAFYGYRIGMNGMLAPLLGKKSINCAVEALSLDTKSAFAWVQNGNIKFYTPSLFGGSKKEALKYYLKAQELMESNQASIREDWNYLSLLVQVAQTHSYLKDYKSSKAVLDKILIIAPDFVWVKTEMYPQIEVKMNY